jgi:glycosyltransferase involved in cell wall biosynthesis
MLFQTGGDTGTPKVSVVIPNWNRRDLLPEAVRSVLLQSFGDFELIVADDGSTDGSLQALGPLSADPRLRIITPPRSGMPGAVRNRGVEAARGRLVAFLDSDDIWLPGKLRAQLELMESLPGCRLVHGREVWLRGEKIVSQKGQRHGRSGDVFADALEKCMIGPSTVLMEKSLFEESGGFREDMEIAEDYELWLRITDRHPVGYLQEPCIVKRAGEWGQLSEKYGQIEKFRIEGLLKLVESRTFAEPLHRRMAEAVLARKCSIYAAGCRKRGRSAEAERFESIAEKYRAEDGSGGAAETAPLPKRGVAAEHPAPSGKPQASPGGRPPKKKSEH